MNYSALITAIAAAHQQAQAGAAGAVNRHLILRNWLIGAHLVEFEQHGEDRAKYGTGLLKRLSADLQQRGIPGTSNQMLERMRVFYSSCPQIRSAISSSPMRISSILPPDSELAISSSPVVELPAGKPTPLSVHKILQLSWTHWIEILRLGDPWKRAFYENECLKGGWSVRQLQRQIGSLLYERTGLSACSCAVTRTARRSNMPPPVSTNSYSSPATSSHCPSPSSSSNSSKPTVQSGRKRTPSQRHPPHNHEIRSRLHSTHLQESVAAPCSCERQQVAKRCRTRIILQESTKETEVQMSH